jgi:hypothetical protein
LDILPANNLNVPKLTFTYQTKRFSRISRHRHSLRLLISLGNSNVVLWQPNAHCMLPRNDFFLLLHNGTARTARTEKEVFDLVAFEAEVISDFAALEGLVSGVS